MGKHGRFLEADYLGSKITVRAHELMVGWVWCYTVNAGEEKSGVGNCGSPTPEAALGAGLRAACAEIDAVAREGRKS